MAGEEIVVDIDKDGNVTVEGVNIEGPHCMALTKEIEEALGERTSVVKKPEFNRSRSVPKKVTR